MLMVVTYVQVFKAYGIMKLFPNKKKLNFMQDDCEVIFFCSDIDGLRLSWHWYRGWLTEARIIEARIMKFAISVPLNQGNQKHFYT